MDWAKVTAIRDEKHLSFGIWCDLYWMFYDIFTPVICPPISSLLPYIIYIPIPSILILTSYTRASHHFQYISYISMFELYLFLPLLQCIICIWILSTMYPYSVVRAISFFLQSYISIFQRSFSQQIDREGKSGRHVSHSLPIVIF